MGPSQDAALGLVINSRLPGLTDLQPTPLTRNLRPWTLDIWSLDTELLTSQATYELYASRAQHENSLCLVFTNEGMSYAHMCIHMHMCVYTYLCSHTHVYVYVYVYVSVSVEIKTEIKPELDTEIDLDIDVSVLYICHWYVFIHSFIRSFDGYFMRSLCNESFVASIIH